MEHVPEIVTNEFIEIFPILPEHLQFIVAGLVLINVSVAVYFCVHNYQLPNNEENSMEEGILSILPASMSFATTIFSEILLLDLISSAFSYSHGIYYVLMTIAPIFVMAILTYNLTIPVFVGLQHTSICEVCRTEKT